MKSIHSLTKKHIRQQNSGNYADKIGKESCANGVAGFLNVYRTEIECDNIECGVGSPLKQAG